MTVQSVQTPIEGSATRPRAVGRFRCAVWASAVTTALGASCMVTAAPALASPVEDYAAYDPQRTCAKTVKPGTAFLLDWLVRRYPGTSASSLLRDCTPGTSEHKDGRALDWGVDVTKPAQQAQADAFFTRVFRTNAAGQQHAMARRMGIMYLVWNDHAYGAYNRFAERDYLSSSCRTRRSCSATLRHRDHVHISLSRSGARAETSFYVARRVGQ